MDLRPPERASRPCRRASPQLSSADRLLLLLGSRRRHPAGRRLYRRRPGRALDLCRARPDPRLRRDAARLFREDRALRRADPRRRHGARPVRRADGVDHRRDRRHRPGDRPGAAGHAAEHRRRHHAPGAEAIPHRRICRGRRALPARSRRSGCSRRGCAPSTASTCWRPIRRCGTSRCATTRATACAATTSRSASAMATTSTWRRRRCSTSPRPSARVHGDPAPTAFVAELGDSAVSVTLRYWTVDGGLLRHQARPHQGGQAGLRPRGHLDPVPAAGSRVPRPDARADEGLAAASSAAKASSTGSGACADIGAKLPVSSAGTPRLASAATARRGRRRWRWRSRHT